MNRRLFFGTILGAFVGAKVAPVRPPWGSTGGAHIGAIPGAFVGVDMASGPDAMVIARLTREWEASFTGPERGRIVFLDEIVRMSDE